jgi:hypothetical protein
MRATRVHEARIDVRLVLGPRHGKQGAALTLRAGKPTTSTNAPDVVPCEGHPRDRGACDAFGTRNGLLFVIPFVCLVALLFVNSAGAAPLVEISRFGQQRGELGGQLENASGLAVNITGVGGVEAGTNYVAEWGNRRIDQFGKAGEFIRTWGTDVNATEPGSGFEICTASSGNVCKKGSASAEAGAVNNPRGIAIDPRSGNVYVVENGTNRIDVFSPEGQFDGAFGYGVDAAAPAQELQFCTTTTGCKEGEPTEAAGGFAQIVGAISVNPTTNDLWIGDSVNHRIDEFSVSLNGASKAVGVTFIRAIGWNIDAGAPAEELQQCTTVTGCKAGTEGPGQGQISRPLAMTVAPSGEIYVSEIPGGCFSGPCRVTKFNADGSFNEIFGPSAGGPAGCQLTNSQSNGSIAATTSMAVDPSTENVILTIGYATGTYQICEFNAAGTLLSRSPAEPPNIPLGTVTLETTELNVALGADATVLVQAPNSSETSWPITSFGLVPAAAAEMEPVTELQATSATLNGEVTTPEPGGPGYDIKYRFEYSADNGATWRRAPAHTNASVGSTAPGPHAVQQKVVGLQPNTPYRVRLATITSFITTSAENSFQTPAGAPLIAEVRARDAGESSVTLEAQINPNGTPTTYRFEWGPTSDYGNAAPVELEPSIGEGHEANQATADLSGLAAASTYHYRVVARSGAFVSASPDQIFETLNSCGLPEGRCFDLVSPRDVGPTDLPAEYAGNVELHFQAASRPGAIAYVSETGLPGATKGAEVLSRAVRGPSGWTSSQISPELFDQTKTVGGSNPSSQYSMLNDELTCGVVASDQPLTNDPGANVALEAGASNLYRQNENGSYTAITPQAPSNLAEGVFGLIGSFTVYSISENCNKVVFEAAYTYPGVPVAGSTNHLYEWENGTLRSVGYVPGSSGPELVGATYDGTSADGSRVFFTSTQVGQPIYVRENGQITREVSISDTGVPDGSAVFRFASTDGSRVFFTAEAGRTAESSPEGVDLYEYDLDTNELTDLSPGMEPGGAQVTGVIGASEDGSDVYFVAKGELVPGQGKTLSENNADDSYSIYTSQDGSLSYVSSYNERPSKPTIQNLIARPSSNSTPVQTSRVSADGRFLLFESSGDVTGYDSGEVLEAYLFDTSARSDGARCISCRSDGNASLTPLENRLISNGTLPANSRSAPRALVVRHGEPLVFFSSSDSLALGASEGADNVYEYSHGQVFLVAAEPLGLQPPLDPNTPSGGRAAFVGASEAGTDLYLRTPQTLTWEDGDERMSIYDARVGGGSPAPPPPPAPCSPSVEGSCQGSVGTPAAIPAPASQTFSGPGNPVQKKHHKKKHHKKKHHKKKHHKKTKRPASGDRRSSK